MTSSKQWLLPKTLEGVLLWWLYSLLELYAIFSLKKEEQHPMWRCHSACDTVIHTVKRLLSAVRMYILIIMQLNTVVDGTEDLKQRDH